MLSHYFWQEAFGQDVTRLLGEDQEVPHFWQDIVVLDLWVGIVPPSDSRKDFTWPGFGVGFLLYVPIRSLIRSLSPENGNVWTPKVHTFPRYFPIGERMGGNVWDLGDGDEGIYGHTFPGNTL